MHWKGALGNLPEMALGPTPGWGVGYSHWASPSLLHRLPFGCQPTKVRFLQKTHKTLLPHFATEIGECQGHAH